jgi:UDP-glucuronate 4-epimerase
MRVLITGVAGFIGYHLANHLILKKIKVFGLDNLNNYYDVNLKKKRLRNLKNKFKNKFSFFKLDITNYSKIKKIFSKYRFDYVVHLAAQAGVRFSIYSPSVYHASNIDGFFNILELSREFKIKHLIFASSSSVYGDQLKFPIKENFSTDFPLSFYAATKKSNEIVASSYSRIYNMKITGLRLFTVYGPYGRPDMSPFKFVQKAIFNEKIDVYNMGKHTRDFTYVDDVVKIIFKILKKRTNHKFKLLNISSSKPIKLMGFVKIIENIIGKKIKKNYLKRQKGDVLTTFASNAKLEKIVGKNYYTNINDGMIKFIEWYKRHIA